jgi:hypothetical protein
MSNNAGTLLWNRRHITLVQGGGAANLIDTLLVQPQQAFGASSVNEPPLGVSAAAPPPDGTTPASRVQVIPLSPLSAWSSITHGEPYFDTTSGTVKVQFHNNGETVIAINVLFWDPHTVAGPGQAQTYNSGQG